MPEIWVEPYPVSFRKWREAAERLGPVAVQKGDGFDAVVCPSKDVPGVVDDGWSLGNPGEEEAMKDALAAGPDADIMLPLFMAAIETGMRLGELLSLRPEQILSADGVRHFVQPDSKNGDPTRVVLSTRASTVLDPLLNAASATGRPIFPLGLHQVEYRRGLASKAAKVIGLKLNDPRHEGLPRMANKGLNMGELRTRSGRRTAETLLRYINARLPEVAKKLG